MAIAGSRAGSVVNRPLAGYRIASTRVPDEAAEIIAQTYCDHEIRILDPIPSLHFDFSEARLSAVTVGAMSFDADMLYDLGVTETYYLIQLADTGSINYVNGGESCCVTTRQGMVTSPTRPLRIHYNERSRGLIVKIPKPALEAHLQALTGAPVPGPLIFTAPIAPGCAFAERYTRLLRYILDELDSEQHADTMPHFSHAVESMLMTALLVGQPHNYMSRFERPEPSAAERQVARTEAFIRENAARPLGIEDFVALTGVSGRSLYRAFQTRRGYSPMAFLRAVRFQLARQRLAEAEPGDTVTAIALESGFDHLGRFSRDYRRRYGEAPSAALKRAVAHRAQ